MLLHQTKKLLRDTLVVFVSVLIAIGLARSNALVEILNHLQPYHWPLIFLGGVLLVSTFTAAPAVVLLASLSREYPLLVVAGLGACGAVCGDLLLFYFIKDDLFGDLSFLFRKYHFDEKLHHLQTSSARYLILVLGLLLWMLPLPDELALSILGLTKTKNSSLIFLSLMVNFITILTIGWSVRLFFR